RVLVLNAGSSTVKTAVAEVSAGHVTMLRQHTVEAGADRSADALFGAALDRIGAGADDIDAVGHRVVHGGTRFQAAARIDDEVEAGSEALVPLAPLHNPVALAGIRAARARLPRKPMVAVFDTTFHAARPEVSRRYALPDDVIERHALHRYGFHGIAHASLV